MGHLLENAEKTLSRTGSLHVSEVMERIDPRARILGACAFAICCAALSSLPALCAALAAAGGMLALSRLPVRRTLRRMAMMDGFIIFTLILLPFTTPGTPFLTLWGLEASVEGLAHAARIGLTANAVILALMTLVGSMEPVRLGHALNALRCPEGLVHLLLFTVRYVEVLRAEYLRLREAMRCRGFRPRTDLHTYRSFGYLVGMMLVRSVERSERILEAMKCRGFTGRIPLLARFRFGPADVVFAAGMTATLACLIVLEAYHAGA